MGVPEQKLLGTCDTLTEFWHCYDLDSVHGLDLLFPTVSSPHLGITLEHLIASPWPPAIQTGVINLLLTTQVAALQLAVEKEQGMRTFAEFVGRAPSSAPAGMAKKESAIDFLARYDIQLSKEQVEKLATVADVHTAKDLMMAIEDARKRSRGNGKATKSDLYLALGNFVVLNIRLNLPRSLSAELIVLLVLLVLAST